MALVAEGSYERNTTAVKRALLTIRQGKPEAVIMIGAYQPCAEFIKVAREIKFEPVFVNISFVGTEALAQALGRDGSGVVVTQVVPFPTDTSVGLVTRYQAAHKALKADATPGFVSLEGYMVGRMVVMALEKLPANAITRASLLDVISHSTFDLGGVTLSYSADNNRGSDHVFLTVIQSDGRIRPVERLTKLGS
jgi:branched-chain amino acid transport system substrate-binding protein